jgi:enterochelin esterase-like enzyme
MNISITNCQILQNIPYDFFWDKVKEFRTPIVESFNDSHCRVTFLFRAKQGINNVVLATYGLCSYDPRYDQLRSIPNTDIYFKSYLLPKETRTIYCFSANDPVISLAECDLYDCEKLVAVTQNWEPDPYNTELYTMPGWLVLGNEDKKFSLLELPNAPTYSEFLTKRDDILSGLVTKQTIKSNYLNSARDIQIYIPSKQVSADYQYPCLVFFDGDAYIEYMNAVTILDNLIDAHMIPPIIGIFISNPPPNSVTRAVDLFCSDLFASFVAKELIPWLSSNYSISKNPQNNTVVGASLGGLFALFLALTHSDIIGGAISQSGAFWWRPKNILEDGWLIREYIRFSKLNLKFYLDVGLLETALTFNNGASILSGNRHMRDVLKAKGYEVFYTEYAGGHDYICWKNTLVDALIKFYGK